MSPMTMGEESLRSRDGKLALLLTLNLCTKSWSSRSVYCTIPASQSSTRSVTMAPNLFALLGNILQLLFATASVLRRDYLFCICKGSTQHKQMACTVKLANPIVCQLCRSLALELLLSETCLPDLSGACMSWISSSPL